MAMSTSLHGSGGGGHSPAATVNRGSNSLGVNNTSCSLNLVSGGGATGVGPNLYIDNGAPAAGVWTTSTTSASSLSPTSGSALQHQQQPPPLMQRKCEVKLNAMP